MRKFGLSVLLLVIVIIPSAALSLTLSGRFTTSLYSWERQDTDTTSSGHLRAYQSAILSVRGSNLSFRTYLRGTNDFQNRAKGDPSLKIYNTYFDWKRIGGVVDLRVGRQPIYARAGVGTIDGIKFKYGYKNYFKISLYAGTLIPLSRSKRMESWSDAHMMGFHITTDKLYRTMVGLSFVRRNRVPLEYKGPGRYTLKKIQNGSLQQELIGLDARRMIGGRLSLYARLDFDLIYEGIRRAELITRYMINSNLRLTGEFIHRAPTIDANSIFSVFGQEANREVGFRGSYKVSRLLSLWAGLAVVAYEGDTSQRINFGAGVGRSYFGYSRRTGYAGQSDGLSANFRHPLNERLWLKAEANFSKYQLFESAAAKDNALAASLGLNYRPTRWVSLDIEGQNLRNKVYGRDLRLFFRANIWFFQKVGGIKKRGLL